MCLQLFEVSSDQIYLPH